MSLSDEDITRLARTHGKFSELVGQRIGFGRKQEGPLDPQPDDAEILLYVKHNAFLMSEARKALIDEKEEADIPHYTLNLDETLTMVRHLFPDESSFSKRYVLSNIKQAKDKLEAVKTHLDAVPKDESDHFPWDISPVSFNKLMSNLYEVLEPTSEVNKT